MIASGTASNVQDFIDGVLSGEIVTGTLVRLAVQRHVDDLAKQSTPDFPYHFDARHAETACDFFPLVLKHSIGDFAGMPFYLEPWQAFLVWCVFGWKRDDDNTRRFRKVYDSQARKNGKSTKAAGVALLLASMDFNPKSQSIEQVAEVILSATKREQSEKVIYAEIERMRVKSPAIEQRSTRINRQITFTHNQGSIRCVGSDKPYDGLNPHAVILDELHAWREHHRKFYDTMQTGSGNRSQPLMLTVTTAGDDQSHLWREEYEYAKNILLGIVKDESVFSYIWEIDENDDPLDENCWLKANPNIGVSVKLEFLRDQARQAKASKVALNRFVRYHCNRSVSSNEKAFDIVIWDKNGDPAGLSDWTKADAVGAGTDLGARDDFASNGYCARFPIGEKEGKTVFRFEVDCEAFISDETTRDLTRQPFAGLVYDEKLKKSRYPIADLQEALIERVQLNYAHAVAYDPYNGQQLGEDLEREGITAARMAQNCANFNEAIRDFMQALIEGRIKHNGNLLLRWCVNNAQLFIDRQDRWMFDKKASSEKIDAIVAVVMAFRVCSLAPARATGSLYL